MGPKFVVIKKGEHGAMFFSQHETYVLPAYPTPDGGRSHRGRRQFCRRHDGLPGRARRLRPQDPQKALAYGTWWPAFTVEDFSLDRLRNIRETTSTGEWKSIGRMLSF